MGPTWNLHSLEQSLSLGLTALTNWFMQQLMGACGIAAHDVLTDEEIEDDDDDLDGFITD